VRDLLPALVRGAPHHEFHILLSGIYQKELLRSLPEQIRPVTVDAASAQLLRRLWFEQFEIIRIIRREGFDLLFTVNEVGTVRSPCAHVMLARNLSVYTTAPELGIRERIYLLGYRLTRGPVARAALRAADLVVFVSDSFRRVVNARLALDPSRTRVVHHGVHAMFVQKVAAAKGSDDLLAAKSRKAAYLLTVSTVSAHKNFEVLLEGYAAASRGIDSFPDLVIAGAITDRPLYMRLERQILSLGVASQVHFVGRLPHDELAALYRHAIAFVFPSRLETFGQPLLEAAASGLPIIASDLPACREVCQDAALYFAPGDSADLTLKILAVVKSEVEQERLRQLGLLRARNFTWDNTAARMIEIFEEAVARRRAESVARSGTMKALA